MFIVREGFASWSRIGTLVVGLCLVLGAERAVAQEGCTVETVIGDFRGPIPDEGESALSAELSASGVRLLPDGRIVYLDASFRVVRAIGLDGKLTTLAGTGRIGPPLDGPALEARLQRPRGLRLGRDGLLYFLDGNQVRRITDGGRVETVAGNGRSGYPSMGRRATETQLGPISGLAVGDEGELFLSVRYSNQIYRVGVDGLLEAYAGVGPQSREPYSGEGGPALEATLESPRTLALDGEGNLYFYAGGELRIRRVTPDGRIETYVGGALSGPVSGLPSPDGTRREEVEMGFASGLEVDGQGRIYWRDSETVRRISLDGTVETAAPHPGPRVVQGLSVSDDGRVFLRAAGRILEAFADGTTTVVAGDGRRGPRGEGGPARTAYLGAVAGMALRSDGTLVYAERGLGRIRGVTPEGTLIRLAGTDELDGEREGVPALEVSMDPRGLTVDSEDRILYSNRLGRVLRIGSTGLVEPFAGEGEFSSVCGEERCGDGGTALEADVPLPDHMAADGDGNVYLRSIGSSRRYRVRVIDGDGRIESLRYRGAEGLDDSVNRFAVAPNGDVFASVGLGHRHRLLRYPTRDEREEVTGADGYLFGAAAMAIHPNGDVYYRDQSSHAVLRLTPGGRQREVFGGKEEGEIGGDGPASEVRLDQVDHLLITPEGDLLAADSGHRRILRVRDVADCPDVPRAQLPHAPLRNGASFLSTASPGAVFSLFGLDLGGGGVLVAAPEGGVFPTELAGTEVLIDGVAAPLIFVSPNQVSGIVPWTTWALQDDAGNRGAVPVRVRRAGLTSSAAGAFLDEAAPAFFTADGSGSGAAAALNEDGSFHGAERPTARGSVVVLFGTGFGATNPPQRDGEVTGASLAELVRPVSVTVGGVEANVLYAGPAPGLVAGVVQVNVRVPEDAAVDGRGVAPVVVRAGEHASPPVDLFVD